MQAASEASSQASEARGSANRAMEELEKLEETIDTAIEERNSRSPEQETDSEPVCEAVVTDGYVEVKDVFA